MTEDEVRKIVAEMFGIDTAHESIGYVEAHGSVSMKMLGELVRESGVRHQFVVCDLRGARTIGGRKP